MLENLAGESAPGPIWSQDFKVDIIAGDVALLTYRSAVANADGQLSHHALRSSLWQRSARGWQMRFHQGTATGAFARR
jgi:hypothetical protein